MIDALLALNPFDWRQPWWLLLMLQPLVLWQFIRWKDSKASNQFADKHLLPWVLVTQHKSIWQKLFSRDTAYYLGVILLAIAMAGPRIPLESSETKHASALDIMLVVDVSASMKAIDIQPSRLQRGAQELHELLTRVQRDDVRFGSIVYAARPHVFTPITNDFDALKFYLKDLDQLVLPTKGSDASAALKMAGKELLSLKSKQAKAILWLSDGDITNKQDQENIEVTLAELVKQNIPTFILGLGTVEGSAIPLRKGGWLEHQGQGVISKMDADLLSHFAELGRGKFTTTSDDESEWQTLYNQGLLKSVTHKRASQEEDEDQQWVEYYAWFLFPGMLLLLIALAPFAISIRRREKQQQPLTSLVFTALMIGLLLSPSENLYAKDNNASASTVRKEAVKNYNNEEYALATSSFNHLVLQAGDDNERAKSLHNLGNNYFQQGDYENAAQLFEDALRYSPNQTQSKNNLALTSELNALLQRRRQRATARRARQASVRGQLGNQGQTTTMLESRVVLPKNLKLPEIPKENLNALLSKGLAHLQMLDSAEEKEKRQKQRNIEQARISLLRDQDSSLMMWKRLFEIEEGFPAKLDTPKTVPGRQPW